MVMSSWIISLHAYLARSLKHSSTKGTGGTPETLWLCPGGQAFRQMTQQMTIVLAKLALVDVGLQLCNGEQATP